MTKKELWEKFKATGKLDYYNAYKKSLKEN